MSTDPLEGGTPPAAAVGWGWVPPLWIKCQLLLLLRGGYHDDAQRGKCCCHGGGTPPQTQRPVLLYIILSQICRKITDKLSQLRDISQRSGPVSSPRWCWWTELDCLD